MLLECLVVAQLVNKFLAFCKPGGSITVFTWDGQLPDAILNKMNTATFSENLYLPSSVTVERAT